MITLNEILENWVKVRSEFSEQEILLLLKKLVFNIETRCEFMAQAPNDILLNCKNTIMLKDYVSEQEHDARYAFSTPFWKARKKAKLSLKELYDKTGIRISELDKLEMGNNDNIRFLSMLAFADGCGCLLKMGASKDLLHARYMGIRNLKELGVLFRKLRIQNKWSFLKLKQETGLSIPFLKRIEHGNLNPKIEIMRKIVKAYDMELITRLT